MQLEVPHKDANVISTSYLNSGDVFEHRGYYYMAYKWAGNYSEMFQINIETGVACNLTLDPVRKVKAKCIIGE